MLNKISQPWPQPLFTPVQMGKLQLPSRIVMAPLTRMRAANPGHAPTELQSSVHQSANLKSIKHYSLSQENAPTYQSLRRLHSPRSVRAFQLRSWRNRTGRSRIKITHCGICHSNLSMLDNEWGMSKYPFVPGHEAVGTVVDLGPHRQSTFHHGCVLRRRRRQNGPIIKRKNRPAP